MTPDMHRVHHSAVPREANSRFGFNMPWWGRFFGTYRAEPAAGPESMTVGIGQFRSPRKLWPDRMLTQPFREGAIDYPFGGRSRDGPRREMQSNPGGGRVAELATGAGHAQASTPPGMHPKAMALDPASKETDKRSPDRLEIPHVPVAQPDRAAVS